MPKDVRVGRLVLLLPFAFAASLPAQAPAGRTKVTIRGSGSDVTIERTPAASAAERRNSFSRSRFPETTPAAATGAGVVGEILRLKAAGADDAMALAYLRLHQSELPSVIAAEDVQALRKAGVGKPFLVALSTLAAVDIGKTGEGQPVPAEFYAPPPEEFGPYGMPEVPYGYGYPVAVGFGGFGGMHHRHFPHVRPHPNPRPGPPVVHRNPQPMMTGGAIRRDVGF